MSDVQRCPDHVSWCTGDHDTYGGCRSIAVLDGHRAEVEVVAIPCDSASVSVSGLLVDVADFDWLIEKLTAAKPLLEAGQREATCTHIE
jgi:hypothetical protein